MVALRRIRTQNFLSLRDIDLHLNRLNVLVGPNGAGKTNLLNVIRFLGDIAQGDLVDAVRRFGGFEGILFRGKRERDSSQITVHIEAELTPNATSSAPDEYTLKISQSRFRPIIGPSPPPLPNYLRRNESFVFKRVKGPGRRITVSGQKLVVYREDKKEAEKSTQKSLAVSGTSSGLSILRRLGDDLGANQVEQLARLFETFRVFEVDVERARQPSPSLADNYLAQDAGNLAAFLVYLKKEHLETFERILDDVRYIVPSFRDLKFVPVGGSSEAVTIELIEAELSGSTPLARASFGTIRALALLAMLHDPNPPKLTCVEEIDHGLHPYALDRIVERLRDASERTQILVATHSPALVNRLDASELIICERDDETGASRIPAIDSKQIKQMEKESGLLPGELWFTGSLGGVI